LEPDNARAHHHRGLAYAADGYYEEAIASYAESIRLTPDLWVAQFNRALTYHLKGDFEGAVAAFTQFIERWPQHGPAYHQRGLAYQARKEFDAAIADYIHAIRLYQNLAEAYTSYMEATRLKSEVARSQKEVISGLSGETKKGVLSEIARTEDPSARILSATEKGRTRPVSPTEPCREEESTKETLHGTAVRGAERTVADSPKVPALPSGMLQLECPKCGTTGLLDVRHLSKKFCCPTCHLWWRTNASGHLEKTTKPEDDPYSPHRPVGVDSKSEIWKPVVSKPAKDPTESSTVGQAAVAAGAMLAVATPPKNPADTASPTFPSAKFPPPITEGVGTGLWERKESSLHYAGRWIVAFTQTKEGRWTAIVGVVFLIGSMLSFLFPSLFASELHSRGQKVAEAWLSRDVEQIKPFTDPRLVENVARWLEATPPPDLKEKHGKPVVSVAVERNDGESAEVLIQIGRRTPMARPTITCFATAGFFGKEPGISGPILLLLALVE